MNQATTKMPKIKQKMEIKESHILKEVISCDKD